jgi:hypothetical protein
MTLFAAVSYPGSVFKHVFEKYFDDQQDEATFQILDAVHRATIRINNPPIKGAAFRTGLNEPSQYYLILRPAQDDSGKELYFHS